MASENVLSWIQLHQDLIREPVLEVGSRRYAGASFLDLRRTVCASMRFVGCDLERDENTDVVLDITSEPAVVLNAFGGERFATIFCVSVLEHIPDIFAAASNISLLLQPGGALFISVPFVFRYHGYPGDFWRFTPEAIHFLFPEVAFADGDMRTAMSTLAPGDLKVLPQDYGKRNRYSYRPRSKAARLRRKLLKLARPGAFIDEYSLAPTMINMVGRKR